MARVKYGRVSYIENFFSKLLTAAEVSDNIFAGTLPTTTDSEWMDMAVIDVQKCTDYDAYTQGTVLIYLYARPKGTPAVKNVSRLNTLEKAFDEALNDASDSNYKIEELWRASDYDSSINFHFNVISVRVTVKW